MMRTIVYDSASRTTVKGKKLQANIMSYLN